ncbi:hypothetical protein JCM3770_003738 [Rhodotorula araucariae]
MPADRVYQPALSPDDSSAERQSSSSATVKGLASLGRGRVRLQELPQAQGQVRLPAVAAPVNSHLTFLAPCRCDGVQPLCGPCVSGAARTGQDVRKLHCDYDTEEERRKPVGGGKVAALEAKIAALERRLAEVTSRTPPSPTLMSTVSRGGTPTMHAQHTHETSLQLNTGYPSAQTALPHFDTLTSMSNPFPSFAQARMPPVAATPTLADPYSLPGQPSYPQAPNPYDSFAPPPHLAPLAPPFHNNFEPIASGPPLPAAPLQQPFPTSYWHPEPRPPPSAVPGNPRLPSYPLLSRLIHTFFNFPHEAVELISRRRFMEAFALPPEHPDYPAKCLLHAMVATATDLAGHEVWEGEERYWGAQGPAEYHADFADVLIPLGFRTERNILQVAQAAVLFACFNLYHGRFSSAYIDTSVAVRICISLGLNHEGFSPRDLPLSSFLSHRTFLHPPRDDEELFERATTWWFAITVETFSAAATGWACCIDERDVTTLIPAAAPYGDDPTAREALYLHSPNFFISNPPHLVRLVQINLKVTVLMNRVCTFIHRTTALANATPEKSPLSPAEFPKIRASPAFTKLEQALETFGRKAPAQLVALLEPEAFLCPSLVATSVILLHERFCTSEDGDAGMAKCAEAARNILQNMQVLNSASFHPRQIPPFLSFCWGVAGRTFVRELAIKHLKGVYDGDEVAQLRGSVQSICARLKQSRTPVGPHMARALVVMLEHPEICLPHADAVAHNPPGVTSIARLTALLDMRNGWTAERVATGATG